MRDRIVSAFRGIAVVAICLAIALTGCGQPAGESSSVSAAAPGGEPEGIGETAAGAVALAHARLTEAEAEGLRVTREYQNGVGVYQVAFSAKGISYRYSIDAASGSVLSGQKETAPAPSSAAAAAEIGEDAAKAAALAEAQLTAEEVTGLQVEQDYDNGRLVYEVEFWQGTIEYECTIDSSSGKVVKYQREFHQSPPQTPVPNPLAPAADGDVGEDAAGGLAVVHAQGMDGVIANQVSGLQVERDYDDGRPVYEVEFWWGVVEYDYTIDGATGTVLKYKKDTHTAETAAEDIGEAAAKAAALAHARLTEGEVAGLRVERDHDRGRLEYEVAFRQGGLEHEYTIDGATGAVLAHEWEHHQEHYQDQHHH